MADALLALDVCDDGHVEAEVIKALVDLYDAAEHAYDRGSVRPLRAALDAVDEASFRAYGRVRGRDEQAHLVRKPACSEQEIQAIRSACGGGRPNPRAEWLLRNGGMTG